MPALSLHSKGTWITMGRRKILKRPMGSPKLISFDAEYVR
jgi:hypothetical protein